MSIKWKSNIGTPEDRERFLRGEGAEEEIPRTLEVLEGMVSDAQRQLERLPYAREPEMNKVREHLAMVAHEIGKLRDE